MAAEKDNVVGIIPARGGSKGIPQKNVKDLNGKPLVAHTIEQAEGSDEIDEFYVSTDDRKIKEASQDFGAEVIDRPEELAEDDSATIDAILHAIDTIEESGERADIVICLQPTSPLRTSSDIDKSIEKFREEDCTAVISVKESEHPPFWSLEISDGQLEPVFGEEYIGVRRQELKDTYMPNGAIFVSSRGILKDVEAFYSEKIAPYVMPGERSLDIDEKIDLKLAELILEGKK